MSVQHARVARVAWQDAVVEGLVRAVEALFLVTLVVLPLDAYLVVPSGRVLGFLSQALTMEMCALFGLTLALNWLLRRPLRLRVRLRELAPLALALLAAGASAVTATSHSVALKECLKALVYLGIFMVARALMPRPHIRYRALLALLIGATVVLIVGFFGAAPGAPDIAGALLDIHRTVAYLPNSTVQRAESTFRYPNELAAYLTLIIPLLVACALATRDLTERVGFLLLAFAGGALLLLTYTRGAQVGVAVALIALLWMLGGRRLALGGLAILVCAGLALVFIPGPISGRLISAVTNSDSWQVFRFSAWSWALSIFLHHPLFGVGIGNINLQPGAPFISAAQDIRELDAENILLNVLAEMGILGGVALLLCLASALRLTLTGIRSAKAWLDRGWNMGVFAALVGVMVYGLSDPVIVSGQVTGLLCALVGLAGAGAHMAAESAPRQRSESAPAQPVEAEPEYAAAGARELRIVFLLNSLVVGGVEMHTLNLAEELCRRGGEPLIVIPPRSRVEALLRERGLPYRVARLGMNLDRWRGFLGTATLANPLSAARCARAIGALAAETPSVFVCPFPREQLLVTRLKRSRALHVVWIIHAPLHFMPHRLIIQPRLRLLSRQADRLITVSETLAQRLTERRYAAERLMVIPNAVASALGAVMPFERRPRATIGLAGRLTASKGAATLIAAMPEIIAQRPETHLVIAGTGAREAALRRQVERLHLGAAVTFLGHVSDMRAFYRSLTVFAHPTVDYEGLPTVILEAHQAALPVVASAVDGVTELVRDHETGLLAWPDDPHSLAEGILTLLDNPALARRLGLTGWRQVRERYTLHHAGARFISAIASLDSAKPGDMAQVSESSELRIVQRSRFVRDTGILLVGKLLTALATALWTVLAARSLASASYGDLMLCAGMVEIAAIITDAGLTAAATQMLTTASAQRANELIGTVLWLKVALGVAAAGVAVGATIALPFTPEARHLMLLLAPGLLFISLTSLALLFRARMDVGYTLIAAAVAAIAGGYGALSVYLSMPSAEGFARARLLMLVVSGVLTLTLVALRYQPRWVFDWRVARQLLRSSALLGLALALNILYYRIDVPLLALLTNSATVAVYTSAYRVLDVATLLPATAATAALPLMLAQPTRERLSAFVSQYLELALVAGLLVSVALTATVHPVLEALYGGRYDSAYPTMIVLAWVAGCTLVTNVFSPLAVALGRRRFLLAASGVALVANFALNIALIPWLGAPGAALATLATELVVTAPLAWLGAHATRLRPRLRPLIAALGATAAWLAAWVALERFDTSLGQGWLTAITVTGVWLLVFVMIAPTWVRDIARMLRMGDKQAQMLSRNASARIATSPPYQPTSETYAEGTAIEETTVNTTLAGFALEERHT